MLQICRDSRQVSIKNFWKYKQKISIFKKMNWERSSKSTLKIYRFSVLRVSGWQKREEIYRFPGANAPIGNTKCNEYVNLVTYILQRYKKCYFPTYSKIIGIISARNNYSTNYLLILFTKVQVHHTFYEYLLFPKSN